MTNFIDKTKNKKSLKLLRVNKTTGKPLMMERHDLIPGEINIRNWNTGNINEQVRSFAIKGGRIDYL